MEKKEKTIQITVQFGPGKTARADIDVVIKPKNKQFDKCIFLKDGTKIIFWAFKGTISANGKYAAVQLPIPTVLLGEKGNKIRNKFSYPGLFLLEPKDKSFLDPTPKDHGQYNCPGKPSGSGTGGLKKGSKKSAETVTFFEFNKNYYHPLISSNWQTFYHVTEQEGAWDDYDPCCQDISADFPIQYDSTLGISYTREISFLPKGEFGEYKCEDATLEECEEKYRKKKLEELLKILFPNMPLDQAQNLFYKNMEEKGK